MRQIGHLEFIDAIHPRRRRGIIPATGWLNHITHLISFVLRRSQESSRHTLRDFAEQVFPSAKGVETYRDRIITFNYDDLLDRHLIRRLSLKRIYFDQIKPRPSGITVQRHWPHPLIIKLHGSVNWRCSQSEFRQIIDAPLLQPGEPAMFLKSIWWAERGTPSPSDAVQPLLVPPIPVKPLAQISLFRFLWTKAYEYLHEARDLVICGYSLPEADRLAMSLFTNFVNDHLRNVTIVDPDPTVLRKWRTVLRRRGIGNNVRWHYYEDFHEYVHRAG